MIAPLVAGGALLASELLKPKSGAGNGALHAGLDEFSRITPPNLQDLQVKLQQLVYNGDITPEDAQTIMMNPSAFEDLTTSGAGRSAQLQALQTLQGISTNGGLTPTDLAELNQVQSRQAQAERGSREAIVQNAKERGIGGSGLELAAQLDNQQGSATRGNQAGLDIAAQAQQRVLQSIMDSGKLGGDIEGQEYGEAAQKASAKDAIAKFNAQNQQDVINRNVAARNEAEARNVAERQRISDSNAQIQSDQSRANATAQQATYDNALKKAAGESGQFKNISDAESAEADRENAWRGKQLSTGGLILASSDETKKKDISNVSEMDIDKFLESLDPKKFAYKDPAAPGANDGENVGVMAQDVEKTPVGKTMVKNTKDGKMLDMQKGLGVILAALAALHDKMEAERG